MNIICANLCQPAWVIKSIWENKICSYDITRFSWTQDLSLLWHPVVQAYTGFCIYKYKNDLTYIIYKLMVSNRELAKEIAVHPFSIFCSFSILRLSVTETHKVQLSTAKQHKFWLQMTVFMSELFKAYLQSNVNVNYSMWTVLPELVNKASE